MKFPSEFLPPVQKAWVRFVQSALDSFDSALTRLTQRFPGVEATVSKSLSLLTASKAAAQEAEQQIVHTELRTFSYPSITSLSSSYAALYSETFTPPVWATRCTVRFGARSRFLMRNSPFTDTTEDNYEAQMRLLINGSSIASCFLKVGTGWSTSLSGDNSEDGTFTGNIVVAFQLRGKTASGWTIVGSGSSLRLNVAVIFQR